MSFETELALWVAHRGALVAIGAEPPSFDAWRAERQPGASNEMLAEAVAEVTELIARLGGHLSDLAGRVAALEASSGGNTFHT